MKPSIDMSAVEDSGRIEAIGFDPATGTMAVQFKNGGLYHYHDVPHSTYASLKAAKSKGSYLHAHVIAPKLKFTRIQEKKD